MIAPILKGTLRWCFLGFLGCLMFACSEHEEETLYSPENEIVTELQTEVFDLINSHRVSLELPALDFLDLAYVKAKEHTAYMISRGEANHDYFFDREAYLVTAAGAESVAENVAYAFHTAKGVVDAWVDSAAHRSVIEGDFTHASICVMKAEDGRYYYTQIFVKK